MNTFVNTQRWFAAALSGTLFFASACSLHADSFQVCDQQETITLTTANYRIEIIKKGFRYGFSTIDGKYIAPPHARSGLEFGDGEAVDTESYSQDKQALVLNVTNKKGAQAKVKIEPSEYNVRFEVTSSGTNQIVARTGSVGPAYGLGDLGMRGRNTTELTGFASDDFRAVGAGSTRLISNFVIFPRAGFAEVNIEPTTKIVRLTADENAQGSKSAASMPALYYFFGSPQQIYASFLEVRNREGWRVYRPKYEWFGVGWEAWGALAWDTNQKTVSENVDRYLSLGYPLSWVIVGSGFWPRQDRSFYATTSFGLWDTNLYPHPREFIQSFHDRGMKFIIGLRIAFLTNGPYASEGLKGRYFITEQNAAKVFAIDFPGTCYLLDSTKPEAVRWYIGLCEKWLDYGVDGFKEDLYGYRNYVLRDDKLNPVNEALMERGVYLMGRNNYLGSAMDLHRFDDFNYEENQDRGPINGMAYAYSGFPYIYPDIIGGTFAEAGIKNPKLTDQKSHVYMMRYAQYALVNPSMSVGFGPWNFNDEQVDRVVLAAAQLHEQLHPYIYSAAIDAFETGFPWTLAPLPIVWPGEAEVYQLEKERRSFEWMFGPSLLACPLYGNDYAATNSRNVYLPPGKWIDFDTGLMYIGPKTLVNFPLPPDKTPLFVGGKGVVVVKNLKDKSLSASVYPVAAQGSAYRFTYSNGVTHTEIRNDNIGWNKGTLLVTDITDMKPILFEYDGKNGSVCFPIIPDHNYRLSGGAGLDK